MTCATDVEANNARARPRVVFIFSASRPLFSIPEWIGFGTSVIINDQENSISFQDFDSPELIQGPGVLPKRGENK